jgi:hypothetical protein
MSRSSASATAETICSKDEMAPDWTRLEYQRTMRARIGTSLPLISFSIHKIFAFRDGHVVPVGILGTSCYVRGGEQV